MQRAGNLGADTTRATGDQHDPIAQPKIVMDDWHARQRYLKIWEPVLSIPRGLGLRRIWL
jgi:hypothetical protein